MVFDEAWGVPVLFGGYANSVGGNQVTNDTWIWNGMNWTEYSPPISPPPRMSHSMVYDSQRQRVVLFGGTLSSGASTNDTWEWGWKSDVGQWTWTRMFPATNPPARSAAAMGYDAARGETILVGGNLSDPALANQTWAWNGTNWFLRSTNLPARTINAYLGPYYTYPGTTMAFDERRKRMVWFGPFSSSDNQVFEWDGGSWTMVKPSGSGGVNDSRGCTAFYDPARRMVAVQYYNTLWYWDGSAFISSAVLLDGVTPTIYPYKDGMTFDRLRRAMVWCGSESGWTGSPFRTREIHFIDGPIILQQPSAVSLEPGQTLNLRAAVAGFGPQTYQWYCNGTPLPTDPRVIGAATPTLTISPAQTNDAGVYRLRVTNACGTVWSDFANVGVGPILRFGVTGSTLNLSWSTVGAVLEEAPAVNGPWTSRPDLLSPVNLPMVAVPARFYRLRVP